MTEETMKSLSESRDAVVERAAKVLERRADRIAARKFMFFPWLRCRMILRKIAKLEKLSKGCDCTCSC